MDYPIFVRAVASDPEAIDSLGIAALWLDEQDCARRWNRQFLDLFPEHDGYIRKGEPYAENLRRFYQARLGPQELPDIETYVADGVARHRRQLAPYEFQHRDRWVRAEMLPLPDGTRLRLWTPASPPMDAGPPAALMVDAGKHVADGTIDQMADGLIVRDAQGRIILANRRFAETYGLATPTQAIGKSFPELLDISWPLPQAADEVRRRWADNSRFPGAPFELPLPGDRWVRVREHRSHDGNLVSTHVDVTDLVRLQRSASESRHRAEELAAMLSREMEERKRTEAQMVQAARMVSLGQMATGIAHELNQPLAAMALAADTAMLLLEKTGTGAIPEAMNLLESIAAASTRAGGIIDHLRMFGRQDDAGIAPKSVSLNEIVESALILTKAAIRAAGISLTVSLDPGAPRVIGKPVQLEQMVMDLLLNARDAIAETRTSEGTIRLAVELRDGQAILTVSDNGGGFSAIALQQALEPFFTTKGTGKGTGLGLSLAYSTVSAMGGTIILRNAHGGAVVRVALPALLPTS